jgi:hypothetical protein
MHCRKLTGDNAAGRLYRILRQDPGRRFSGPELAKRAANDPAWPLTALGTCIAEVRQQLPSGELIIVERRGHGFWYSLKLEAGEPALFDLGGRNRL